MVAILNYANEEIYGAKKAGPPSFPHRLLVMKMQIQFDALTDCTFGARAKMENG